MARKSKITRKSKMTHRKSHRGSRKTKRTMRRRTHRKRGGEMALRGAPANYSLAGNWSSRMSLGQGEDFFKYHEGQHGGEAPFPGSVTDSMLPSALRGPAHIAGIDKAIADVRPLRDENQMGGRRKRSRKHRSTKRKSHGKKHRGGKRKSHGKKSHRKTHRKSHRRHRRRGGSLGYAPVSAPGMLLSGPKAYAEAGLNPEWKTAVEFTDAKIRSTQ